MKYISIICTIAITLVFMSCSEKIGVKHNADNSISLSIESKSSKNLDLLIAGLTGSKKDEPLFNAREIEEEIKARNAKNAKVKTSAVSSIEMEMTFTEKDALSPLFTESDDGKHFILTLSEKTISQFMRLLPSDASDYTDLLLAPVFTGDKMSAAEYVQSLAAIYGNDVSSEMKNAKLEFAVVSKNGVKQTLNLSLVEILCLEGTKKYTFDW